MTRHLRPGALGAALALLGAVAGACGGGASRATSTGSSSASSTTASPSSTPPPSGAGTTTPSSTTTFPHSVGPATTAGAMATATIGNWTGVEPSTIYFSGDSGDIVTGITWVTWTATSAVGGGSWGYDDCDPDCAQGTVTTYPTTISLSDPVDGQFTTLVEDQSGPHGMVQTFTLPDRGLGGASS